ncbi:biotin transporter BioY [Corynebacterium cystitidis]|uniref:biotin transporter BioY n=1 Tax=Corynebacterium cystitidis TaxID=35757 RepID=UPI00211EF535|nr:biotin transporter BioY [Corynebacterium cystitidis]
MSVANGSPSSRSAAMDIAYIAVFAALIIVLAFVSIPVGAAGIPIVLQNAACILAGLVLGARRGFLSVALFLVLGLIGLPVLAGGRTTLAALAGPSVGYLVGYMFSALFAGLIAYGALRSSKQSAYRAAMFILAGIIGLLTQYLFGAIGLMIISDLTIGAAAAAQVPFLVPDTAKVVVMIAIALGVHQAFPDLARKN